MNRMLPLLMLLLPACGPIKPLYYSVQAGEYRAVVDDQVGGGPFHSQVGWGDTIEFVVSDQAPSAVIEAAILAAETWNDAVGREILVCQGSANLAQRNSLYDSLNDTKTAIYYEKSWISTTERPSETLGLTIWKQASDSELLVKGDIILNAEVYEFLDLTLSVPKEYQQTLVVDAQTILVHELGHLLGLDHISEREDPDSVMHAKTYVAARSSLRKISPQDDEHISSLYK